MKDASKFTSMIFLIVVSIIIAESVGQNCLPTNEYPSPPSECMACPIGCQSCFAENACSSCNGGYFMEGGNCERCPFGCSFCSNETSCATCSQGLYIDPKGSCLPCSLGVRTCTIAVVDSCKEGYFYIGAICASCIPSCSSCEDFVTCRNCQLGYYLAQNSMSCLQCGQHCQVCTNETICTSCSQGYSLYSGLCSKQNCDSVSLFCTKCQGGICTECEKGKYLENGECKLGASLLCNSATGKYYTNCDVGNTGCPSFATEQRSIIDGSLLPVCLPVTSTQTSETLYFSDPEPSCPEISCTVATKSQIQLETKRGYYQINYHIKLKIFGNSVQNIKIKHLESESEEVNPIDATKEFSLGLTDQNCGNCAYGIISIEGILDTPASGSPVNIEISCENKCQLLESLIITQVCLIDSCLQCSSASTCLLCEGQLFLEGNRCVTQCSTGYYKMNAERQCLLECPSGMYPVQSSYVCKVCENHCETCTSQTHCLSCESGYFLDEGSCIVQCPEGKFGNVTTSECESCKTPCSKCKLDSSPSPILLCTQCSIGYLLINGTCSYICPWGSYPTILDEYLQCSECNSTCSHCQNQDICLLCEDPLALNGSLCIPENSCPEGTYAEKNANGTICTNCRYPCQTCTSSTSCLSCSKGVLSNNKCLGSCPENFFARDQFCFPCQGDCLNCLSEIHCLSCKGTLVLVGGSCVTNCPSGSYASGGQCVTCRPPCLTCQSETECASCTTGYLHQSACLGECPLGTFSNTNFQCEQCAPICKKCSSVNICLECLLPSVLENGECISEQQCQDLGKSLENIYNYSSIPIEIIEKKCVPCTVPCKTCPLNSPPTCLSCIGVLLLVPDLGACVSYCPQGYYLSSGECLACATGCLSCETTSTQCTTCPTGTYLSSSTCVLTCPSGNFGNNENNKCLPCVPPCGDCLSLQICLTCVSGILYQSSCIDECPINSLLTPTNICLSCEAPCERCENTTTSCLSCGTGTYLVGNQCLVQCPEEYYEEPITGICEQCIQPCKTCASSTECQSCSPSFYLITETKTCTTICPEGTFTLETPEPLCQPCNITICRTCSSSPNNCTACVSPYFYNGGMDPCVESCPEGKYPETSLQICQECLYPCLKCTSNTQCLECGHGYYNYNGYCYSTCPRGYFPINGSFCSQCKNTCEVCLSEDECSECKNGYLLRNSDCVESCPEGEFRGFHSLSSFPICVACPSECLTCSSTEICLTCKVNYLLLSNMCVSTCPSAFFENPTNKTCAQCPDFCEKCTNETFCENCSNVYIYNNLCYEQCPPKTYAADGKCFDCILPCETCTSEFSCQSCPQNLIYYQNYCLETCPEDIWFYPEQNICSVQCPENKYVEKMHCYTNGCGTFLVQLGGYCLESCPEGYFVDSGANCIKCEGHSQCKKVFKADLQILTSRNLQAVIYFSQLIDPKTIKIDDISVFFTSSSTSSPQTQYKPSNIAIDEASITIEFGFTEIQLQNIQVTIPYVLSRQSEQRVIRNRLSKTIHFYQDYQYEEFGTGEMVEANGNEVSSNGSSSNISKVSSSSSSRSEELNPEFAPHSAPGALTILVCIVMFVGLLGNLFAKSVHYRQLLDFLQICAAFRYLEIQYPPILDEVFDRLGISMFNFLPQISNYVPYTFSPSKIIENHKDSSLVRSQGIILIVFLLLLAFVAIVLIIDKIKPETVPQWLLKRLKYRNLTDIIVIFALPLLIFCFRGGRPIDIALSAIVSIIVIVFLIFCSWKIVTAKSVQEVEGLAGELEKTSNVVGLMYIPFSLLRKIIFALVICVQPEKPISSVTLLLIFTVLIMVCLVFYQPFENQITDYVCIGIELALIIGALTITILSLNAMSAESSHKLSIFTISIILLGGFIGLFWLVWLTIDDMKEIIKGAKVSEIQLPQNIENNENNENTAIKTNEIHVKPAQDVEPYEDEHSANQLLKQPMDNAGRANKKLNASESVSSENEEEFKHWNNSESESENGEKKDKEKVPKYLRKVELECPQGEEQLSSNGNNL